MAENKEIGKILETKDYDRFRLLSYNRDVDRRHVNNLKEEFKKGYNLAPISVTSEFVIQEGQHRYQAAREMNLPIRYFFGEKLTPERIAAMNNTTKKWTNEDFAKTFSREGNDNYRVYRAFRTQFPKIPHACALALLTNENSRGSKNEEAFRSGDFVVQNQTKANEMANEIKAMGALTPIAYRQGFILALLHCSNIKGFKIDRLSSKLSHKAGDLLSFSKISDFIRAIEKIYNWKEPDNRKLRLFDLPV